MAQDDVMTEAQDLFQSRLTKAALLDRAFLPGLLDRWAGNRTKGTIHAAIPLLGSENRATAFAVIEKLAGMRRHGFGFLVPTLGAGDG